ncbi:MAG: hypothetical protein ACREBG_09030 [Pyrinomonadaceae bacterium]
MTTTFIAIFLVAFSSATFGAVRWPAQRDTALDSHEYNDSSPKRRRRFALPAHSKVAQPLPQAAKIQSSFDPVKNVTTVRMAPVQISGEKDKYYSLHFAASFSYPGQTLRRPEVVDFELRSIVKARKLKIDLYVMFQVDGETIFLSSNRSAIKNAMPGRRWVGERLVFRMPYETLLKITQARKFAIKVDAVTFEVGEAQMDALRDFVKTI